MQINKELQKGIRDNFIVALVAYIKVGNTEQFVDDLGTITNFFSKLPSNPSKLYGSLYPNSESYNNISEKVEALINYIKK